MAADWWATQTQCTNRAPHIHWTRRVRDPRLLGLSTPTTTGRERLVTRAVTLPPHSSAAALQRTTSTHLIRLKLLFN
ncbi:hypothetical protein J6590_092062 [Homalodisca vitripennis]|nr:hypothetical protein J6590_092062 [Homalodisca vitripennis]